MEEVVATSACDVVCEEHVRVADRTHLLGTWKALSTGTSFLEAQAHTQVATVEDASSRAGAAFVASLVLFLGATGAGWIVGTAAPSHVRAGTTGRRNRRVTVSTGHCLLRDGSLCWEQGLLVVLTGRDEMEK